VRYHRGRMSDPAPAELTPFEPEVLATLAGSSAGTMIERIGVEFLDVARERIVARIPVQGNTQPYGLLHGGATAALLETIGSLGTALLVGPARMVTGIELNVNHIRAVREGHATAVGTPLHVGRTTAVWDFRVHDDQGRLTAAGRLTLAIRPIEPTQG
jgi:1,4-dihydroxy-2-naphthoyl-CoA hydrolase